LPTEVVLSILQNPDSVWLSNSGRLIFWKDGNIVLVQGLASRSGALNVVTSYGPSGPRGVTGVAALGGGNPSDPGDYIKEASIRDGTMPAATGGTLPPAIQIK
jgi:hypothetical protein